MIYESFRRPTLTGSGRWHNLKGWLAIAAVLLCDWSWVQAALRRPIVGNWRKLGGAEDIPGRFDASSTWCSDRRQILVFGGTSNEGSKRGDAWIFDLKADQWLEVSSKSSPRPRNNHTATYDPIDQRVLVIGGSDAAGISLSDAWSFDLKTYEWREIVSKEFVSARSEHMAALDPKRRRLYVTGGWDGGQHLGDTWYLDLNSDQWHRVDGLLDGLPPRRNHGCIVDGPGDRLVVFGGLNGGDENTLGDTWVLDFESGKWREVHSRLSPAPRGKIQRTMMVDASNRQAWLVGGMGGVDGLFNDLWRLDLKTDQWTPLNVDGISPRVSTAVLHPSNRFILIAGGWGLGTHPHLGDTWAFDIQESQWKKIQGSPSFSPRVLSDGLFVDGVNNSLLVVGGLGVDGGKGDAWELPLTFLTLRK